METLTEEQREHEAMELVNLIDKLNTLGVIQTCKLDSSGRPVPIEHILELRREAEESLKSYKNNSDDND